MTAPVAADGTATPIPWPPEPLCAFRPLRREGTLLVFQERYAAPGHAPRRVWLSAWQIDRGLIEALEIAPAWLAEHFPPAREDAFTPGAVAGAAPYPFSAALAAAWLRAHIAASEAHHNGLAAARQARRAMASRAPAPDVYTAVVESGPSGGAVDRPTLRTVVATRQGGGPVRLALTVALPGSSACISVGTLLPAEHAQGLAAVLAGAGE